MKNYYTYKEVLDLIKNKSYILDASGIDEPNDYLWYIHNNVFYPYLN